MLLSRLSDHRGNLTNKVTDKSTGEHFNFPGHFLADLGEARDFSTNTFVTH